MTDNEQVQEMARDIELLYYCEGYEDDRGCYWANTCTFCKSANREKSETIAKHIYSKNYRKASEVAKVIFEEIEKRIDSITIVMGRLDSLRTYHKTLDKVMAELAELKKKYTEGEK